MKFDSLIFDLDGTLWDSTAQVTRAWNEKIKDFDPKRVLSVEEVAGIMGKSHHEIFQTLFPNLTAGKKEELARHLYKGEIETLKKSPATLFPGVFEGIPFLSTKFSICLVSNCQVNYMETFLKVSKLSQFILDWECYGRTLNTKGENIKAVIKRNNFRSAAYIGDTAGDEEAAQWANISYFHVDYGFGEPRGECQRFATFSDVVRFFAATE